MSRAFIFCSCLIISTLANAAIYKWVDHQGRVNYSQIPPQKQSITSKTVIIKIQKNNPDQVPPKSIIDSAKEIAESNAKREAFNNDKILAAKKKKQLNKKCASSRANLAKLESGSNRLYKNPQGEYSRFTAEDKESRRQKIMSFINKNCR